MTAEVITAFTALGVAAISGSFSYVTAKRVSKSSERADDIESRLVICEQRCDACEQRCDSYRRSHIEALIQIEELQADLSQGQLKRFRLLSDLRDCLENTNKRHGEMNPDS